MESLKVLLTFGIILIVPVVLMHSSKLQIMESTLQIMPVQRTSRNFGEFAEEAVIIE